MCPLGGTGERTEEEAGLEFCRPLGCQVHLPVGPRRRRPKERFPTGGEEHDLALHIEANLHAALVDCPVMDPAQETAISKARLLSISPMFDMMRFREPSATPRKSASPSLVTIALGPDGQVLGAGRKTRTVPPSVRRALEARDRGCRFPGCGSRFTEAHHVKHWADGGETSLRNGCLLCRRHHRAVHEGGVQLCLDVKGQVVFFTPRGKALLGAPPAGANVEMDFAAGRPNELLTGHLPGHLTGASRWAHDRDIPWEVEARAWEALDSG